ncbi:MAG TPA: class I SAM-dependent methyltransferase [Lacunisphaera sp.]|jgi:2-polyprenyl-3-methyl-5-hydroxy-6-metoxy-1,4-benzoquinol methylase
MTEPIDQIKSTPCTQCILCGSQGAPLYHDLRDRLFDAPGSWNLKTCSNPECGLLWLDPLPFASEIWKAYKNYYTHSSAATESVSRLKQHYLHIKSRWLSRDFGYPLDPSDQSSGFMKQISLFIPMLRQLAYEQVRFLPFVAGGKLLDVGCGSGDWMEQMRALGWTVEGVDFDPKAVQAACDLGMKVRVGSVEEQSYPNASFDAVTLNHVIEHVPDPIRTIQECARILKPGGKLVMFTPNAASLSHRYFKQDWRGLEPPRHLHIFSFESMRQLFNKADFAHVSIKPDVGTSASFESVLIRKSRKKSTKVTLEAWRKRPFWRMVSLFQHLTVWLVPTVAECQMVIAVKS